MLAGVCACAVVVAAVVLFVSALHKNDQITRLRSSGVPVEMTVTGCQGLIGGSGSNLVGYQCRGTFALSGRHYSEAIPGSVFRSPGTTFQAVVVKDDPALLAPASAVAAEHVSTVPYLLPAALVLVPLVGIATMAFRRRRSTGRKVVTPAAATSTA